MIVCFVDSSVTGPTGVGSTRPFFIWIKWLRSWRRLGQPMSMVRKQQVNSMDGAMERLRVEPREMKLARISSFVDVSRAGRKVDGVVVSVLGVWVEEAEVESLFSVVVASIAILSL